eukprot:871152-Rhodomonas_salina.3
MRTHVRPILETIAEALPWLKATTIGTRLERDHTWNATLLWEGIAERSSAHCKLAEHALADITRHAKMKKRLTQNGLLNTHQKTRLGLILKTTVCSGKQAYTLTEEDVMRAQELLTAQDMDIMVRELTKLETCLPVIHEYIAHTHAQMSTCMFILENGNSQRATPACETCTAMVTTDTESITVFARKTLAMIAPSSSCTTCDAPPGIVKFSQEVTTLAAKQHLIDGLTLFDTFLGKKTPRDACLNGFDATRWTALLVMSVGVATTLSTLLYLVRELDNAPYPGDIRYDSHRIACLHGTAPILTNPCACGAGALRRSSPREVGTETLAPTHARILNAPGWMRGTLASMGEYCGEEHHPPHHTNPPRAVTRAGASTLYGDTHAAGGQVPPGAAGPGDRAHDRGHDTPDVSGGAAAQLVDVIHHADRGPFSRRVCYLCFACQPHR